MGALRGLSRRSRIGAGLPGHAIVMRVSPGAGDGRVALTLSVELPERRPYVVSSHFRVPDGKRPWPGKVLPVTVDMKDPQRVRIDWERVPAPRERVERVRAQIAARGGREALEEFLRERR